MNLSAFSIEHHQCSAIEHHQCSSNLPCFVDVRMTRKADSNGRLHELVDDLMKAQATSNHSLPLYLPTPHPQNSELFLAQLLQNRCFSASALVAGRRWTATGLVGLVPLGLGPASTSPAPLVRTGRCDPLQLPPVGRRSRRSHRAVVLEKKG